MVLSYVLHKDVNDIVCDFVNSVVVVTEFGEVAFYLIVYCKTAFISDNLNLSVLDS